jgi:hypothetical protein
MKWRIYDMKKAPNIKEMKLAMKENHSNFISLIN